MNFTDLGLWLLLLVLAVASLGLRALFFRLLPGVKPGRVDLLLLIATSLALFASFDLTSWSILLGELALTWLLVRAGLGLTSPGLRRLALGVNIAVLVGVLALFKYAPFLPQGLLGAPGLPAGISFYTFQLIAFIVDSYAAGRPALDGTRLLASSSFFPLVVSGPIERAGHLGPQLADFTYTFPLKRLADAFPMLILGLFYKFVLADNLSAFINGHSADNPYLIWLFCLFSGLQLYFDFAGYSFIAVGIARCFGIELILNFLAPYTAESIRQFWRRWHVSLLCWLRDYIYIPLGGSRRPWWFANVLIVWLVSGMWHGAGWSFILWGLLHAVYIGIAHFAGRRIRMPSLISTAMTFVAVTFSWLFFFETDVSTLGRKVATLATPGAYGVPRLMEAVRTFSGGDVLPMAACLLLALIVMGCEFARRRKDLPYEILLDRRVSLALLCCLPLLCAERSSPFVYFAF